MADAIYKQALDTIVSQLPSIGDGITGLFTDPTVVPTRALDWSDVATHGGLTVRYDEQQIREITEGTNERDIYGYPCFIIHCQGSDNQVTDDVHAIMKFFRDVRRYYHNKRRMGAVSESGVNELVSVVSNGPMPPRQFVYQCGKRFRSLTVWCWFLEPRTA